MGLEHREDKHFTSRTRHRVLPLHRFTRTLELLVGIGLVLHFTFPPLQEALDNLQKAQFHKIFPKARQLRHRTFDCASWECGSDLRTC